MKSSHEILVLCFVVISLFFHSATAHTQTTIQEITFTYENTDFALFQTSPIINQPDAQTQCINWGGNLATIKSGVEDYLLLYSSPDLDTIFSCHIGLNDIDNEAGTNGNAFVWIDGNTSSYRNWGTLLNNNPVVTANYDCVRNRYRLADELSQGWLNAPCTYVKNCYFCSKPGVTNGCDLAYNSSCYKVFEVSTPINWLDAQSSCAIWGGDLTSITTERENNYLNTLITSSVDNCWIGLNDRDVEGTYTWIDGTTFTLPYFTYIQSNSETNDCVEIEKTGYGWILLSCETTRGSYLCERNSTVTAGARFGELVNRGLSFSLLEDNIFLYNSLTLACGGQENDVITWKFSENSDLLSHEELAATYTSNSWLYVDNTKQGYYQCQISSSSYTVGVYDTSVTTVAASGATYTYLEGVDRENILLLCDPMDSGTLSTLKWDNTYSNPFNIHSVRSSLPTESTEFVCSRGTATTVSILLSVTVPTLVVMYEQFLVGSYPLAYPATNGLNIPLKTKHISLSMNIVGKWSTPSGTNSTGSTFQISELMIDSAGIYTFYTYNWDGVEVDIEIHVQLVLPIEVPVPTVSFIFDGTQFGYFTLPTQSINWVDAELRCMVWNGHLSTMRSLQDDTLLLHSIVGIKNVSCFIGLNDRDNEAMAVASAFVWVDGSDSTYRQFGNSFELTFPIGNAQNDENDCVRFRYVVDMEISNGWFNQGCDVMRSCYFCNRPAVPSSCDMIYEGFCYKVFEVSTPINWLDSQSSCAIWGGDLTSITTERENNYLNTLITNSMGNCWIGLNDRDNEGIYTWIDGTAYSEQIFVTIHSNTEAKDCVYVISDNTWGHTTCTSTLTSFICKATPEIMAVERFGELINEGLKFQTIIANTFLFNSLTLACGGEESTTISWKFSRTSDFATSEELIANPSNSETGLSWFYVDISKQGYYQCQIGNGIKYIIGLYDQNITTVAVSGSTYSYTVEIDRIDASLLCNPNGNSIHLSSLVWDIDNGNTLRNPIHLFEWSDTLTQQTYRLTCPGVGSEFIAVTIIIYVPILTVSTTESSIQFSALYPANNPISLKVRTEDFSLSANLPGRWRLPNDTSIDEQSIVYHTLDYQYFGLYQYLINNWDGNEVVAIQITLIPDGFVVTDPISLSNAPIQNDSIVFASQGSSMIHCAVSSLSDNIQWTFRSKNDGMFTDITYLATFSQETGFSTLVVTANKPGYYSCIINTLSVYTFSVLDEYSIVRVDSIDDPLQQVNFTVDSPVSLLYYPSSAVGQTSVSHRDIHWTTDTVIDGEEQSYSFEYSNPADLNTVFSIVGGGVHTFSCFYRMSPVTLLGSLQLALKDTARIAINYDGFSMTFSDENNPMFPSAQVLPIKTGTIYVVLTCGLPECVWMTSNDSDVIRIHSYIIPDIPDSYSETFSLMRMTNNGVSYSTAHVHIHAQIVTQSPSSSTWVAVGVIVLILMITFVAVTIFIPLCIFCLKKWNKNR